MTDLETRLAAAMRAHEGLAPTAEEVSVRSYRVRTSAKRHRGRRAREVLIAAFCATAVAIGGGTMAVLATRGSSYSQSGPGGPDASYPIVTAYLVEGRNVAIATVRERGSGPARVVALRSLFAQPSATGRFNGWAGVHLLGLTKRSGIWLVNVDRAPLPAPDAAKESDGVGLVLQQLAWSLSAAARSADDVRVEVSGKPLTSLAGVTINQDAHAQSSYLTADALRKGWGSTVCGPGQAVSVAGRRVEIATIIPSNAMPQWTAVSMRVGQTLTWLPDGLCFAGGGIAVLKGDTWEGTGSATWTATQPGTYSLALMGDAAARECDFVGQDCDQIKGPDGMFGQVRVRVAR